MTAEESATTGADLLVKALIDEEVEVVFGYPGGAVLPIYDSLFKQNRLRHILVRHEQAAVHAESFRGNGDHPVLQHEDQERRLPDDGARGSEPTQHAMP